MKLFWVDISRYDCEDGAEYHTIYVVSAYSKEAAEKDAIAKYKVDHNLISHVDVEEVVFLENVGRLFTYFIND